MVVHFGNHFDLVEDRPVTSLLVGLFLQATDNTENQVIQIEAWTANVVPAQNDVDQSTENEEAKPHQKAESNSTEQRGDGRVAVH